MKKLFLLTILSLILLFPLYSSNDKSEDFNIFSHCYKCDGTTYRRPPGLSEINITWWGGWRNAYLLTPENILKYSYDQTEFIKKVFENKNVPFDFNNVNKVVEGTYRLINKAWWDALEDLKKCESFKDAQNGIPYNEFINYLKKNSFPLEFDNQVDKMDCFAYTLSNSKEQKMMRWPHSTLKAIINYLIDNSFELTNYKSNQTLKDFYNYIAHEMLHMYTDFYDHPSRESVTPDDCEINCILKSCGFSVEVNSKCNKLCYEGYCNKNTYKPCESTTPQNGVDKWKTEHGDDNYSYASGNEEAFSSKGLDSVFGLSGLSGSLDNVSNDFRYSYYPDILIYNKFELDEMERLLKRSEADNFIDDFEHIDFSNNHKTLIVPSGELMGEKDSELIKQAFKRYVENGGTLLVFGQQYGEDFEKLVPVPDGESLKVYGWREDQSCWSASAYISAIHPAISSWVTFWTVLGSFITDGYIESYPSTSTVLLKRTKNQKPFLLFYPYGNGTVILTTMFTDWTYAHSQATTLELRIIRDLITFARNPNKDIPIYDLRQAPNPDISLNANIKNNTEQAATKVKFSVYNPNRNKTFYQNESSISLNSQDEIESPLSFRLQGYDNSDYGICHVDYELYDADNNLLQPASESDGGRFVV